MSVHESSHGRAKHMPGREGFSVRTHLMNNTEIHSAEAAPTLPPQQVLMQISQGMWLAQTVATAARLGIADALAQSQPQDSTTLARAVGPDARALTRLLRALSSVGVLAEP